MVNVSVCVLSREHSPVVEIWIILSGKKNEYKKYKKKRRKKITIQS